MFLKANQKLLIPFRLDVKNLHTRSRSKFSKRSNSSNKEGYSSRINKYLNYTNLKRFMYGLGFLFTGYSINKQLQDPNSILYKISNQNTIKKSNNKHPYILKVDKYEDNLNEYHNAFLNASKKSNPSKIPKINKLSSKDALLIDLKKNDINIPEGKEDDFLLDLKKLYASYQESSQLTKECLKLRNKTELNLLYKKELKQDIQPNEINELEILKSKYKECNEKILNNQLKIVEYLLQYIPKNKLESEYNIVQNKIIQLTNAILNIQESSILGTSLLSPTSNKLVYVLKFDGDVNASSTDLLREEVTAILSESHLSMGKYGPNSINSSDINVVMRLNSSGGKVTEYGLAAAQLVRLKEAGISLTICVDEIAASGGYLMASTADKIICSPLAIIGSIGVVTTIPNFSERLTKEGISIEVTTAGDYKRTITPYKKVTSSDRIKHQENLIRILNLFKRFLNKYRPSMNIDELATGETWIGPDALEKGLVDEIGTIDEYLLKLKQEGADIYNIRVIKNKPSISNLFTSSMNGNIIDDSNLMISQLFFYIIKELFLHNIVTDHNQSKTNLDWDDYDETKYYNNILLKYDINNKYLTKYNK